MKSNKRRLKAAIFICSALLINFVNCPLFAQTVCNQISAGQDDIEEYGAGLQYFNSSDLEFVNDVNRGDQIVGLRFNFVGIPQGSIITGASLRFTADETQDETTSLLIKAQAVDNAPSFNSTDYDLSTRPLGSASVSWTPNAWTVGENGANQTSPDLSTLVQEVIDRPGYSSNSSIVFVISGSGKRVAESFDGAPEDAPELCVTYQTTYSSDLHINEVMASNDNTIADDWGEYDDWIEIYNSSSAPIDLGGYFLSDNPTNPAKYQVPVGSPALTTIPAFGHKLIWADEDNPQGPLPTNFKLSSSGESLPLAAGNGAIIDSFTYTALLEDNSFGRSPDASAFTVNFQNSTPEGSNSSGQQLVVTPTISPEGGVKTSDQLISISSPTLGAVIRYTLDGSEPTNSSQVYTAPFTISDTETLRASAFHSTLGQSVVATESYIFYETDLPIISITMNPYDLWDNTNGMYVIGTNGIGGNCMPQPANFNNEWDKPANITMIETDGTVAFNTNAALQISGGCSRTNPQKSFNIKARSAYGESHFNHQLFTSSEQDKFKRFKLRNGGNGFARQTVSDPIVHLISEDEVDIDQQRVRPVVLFINGEYWGMMNIREAVSEHYINEHHDVDKDSIDLIFPYGSSANVLEGSSNDYEALWEFIDDNDLSVQANYEYVKTKIDINEFINYQIIQVYVQNTDWPGNNIKMWREQKPDSKWRCVMYDVDWGMGFTRAWGSATQADYTTNSLYLATHPTFVGWPFDYRRTLFLRKLLENSEFNTEFIQRFATQMGTIFEPSRCQAICDDYYAQIINEKPAHTARWDNTIEDRNGSNINMSMNLFQNEFDYVRAWFPLRPSYMKTHIRDYFSINGMYTLNIPVTESTNGYVLLNENEYRAPNNYAADYFDGVAMRLKAVPKPGFKFSHWLETGSSDPIEIFTSSSNITRTPVFIPGLQLRINEIHYNPESGATAEFIEIVNTSDSPISLQGVTFTKGIEYTFDLPVSLPGASAYPNNHLVLAHDFNTFQNTYGFPPFGQYSGKLDNNGEKLILEDSDGDVIDELRWYDDAPWDELADDGLHSLARYDFSCDDDLPECWAAQPYAFFTPGSINFPSVTCPADFTLDGQVNVMDFLELNSFFGLSCTGCRHDLNNDGVVNVSDFLDFNTLFGQNCPTH